MVAIQQPVYGISIPPTPLCAPVLGQAVQTQTFGGAAINDGMSQSGPGVSARAAFLASLQSYVLENFDSKVVAGAPNFAYVHWPIIGAGPQKLSILGGAGEIYGSEKADGLYGYALDLKIGPGANGRFNTTANAVGNWLESPGQRIILDLTSTYTAFGCFYMDLGDFGGELEIEFWNGATKVRIITAPTRLYAKASQDKGGWISFADGNIQFNRVIFKVRQFSLDPSEYDYCGWDDMAVGQCVTCTATAGFAIHYGINTTATTAKTVAGPAKTARDAFDAALLAASITPGQYGWEDQALGAGSVSPLAFAGTAVTATWEIWKHASSGVYPYGNVEAAGSNAAGDYAIADAGGSARWNTTGGGTKWLEFKDTLVLNFNLDIRNIGFYVTDLGQQNATLRITLRQSATYIDEGPAVVHYMPKAAELASPNGLLRFWGITNEIQFRQVVIQVVYYDSLTADEYSEIPAWASVGSIETVGIDDIVIGV